MNSKVTHTSTDRTTLWELKKGQSCVLLDFDDSLDSRYKERILELGFRPKTKITCLKAPSFSAPKVYQINNSVFSLEDTVASCINIAIN